MFASAHTTTLDGDYHIPIRAHHLNLLALGESRHPSVDRLQFPTRRLGGQGRHQLLDRSLAPEIILRCEVIDKGKILHRKDGCRAQLLGVISQLANGAVAILESPLAMGHQHVGECQ